MSSIGVNVSVVRGTLASPPRTVDLPSGDRLVNLSVTVRSEDERTESVPVAWLNPPESCLGWDKGDEVVAVGRVSRRFFQAGGRPASRTEVAATTVAHVRQRSRARRAVEQAVADAADAI